MGHLPGCKGGTDKGWHSGCFPWLGQYSGDSQSIVFTFFFSFFFLLSFLVDRSFNFLNNKIKFSNRFSSAFQNSTSKTSGLPLVRNNAGPRPTRHTLSIEAKGNPHAPLQNQIPFQSMRLWEQQLWRGEEWWPKKNNGQWCLLICSMYSHSLSQNLKSTLQVREGNNGRQLTHWPWEVSVYAN